jgi:hypothetical protein
MACTLSSGIALTCRESVGGIKTAYILDASGAEITLTEANGVVTAMSVGGSSVTSLSGDMFEFEQTKQTASLVSTVTASEENGTVFHSSVLSLVFNKLEATKLNQLKLLAANSKLVIVVKDNNDKFWMVGNENGAVVSGGSAETGTAFGDRSGVTIEFTGLSKSPIFEVTITE